MVGWHVHSAATWSPPQVVTFTVTYVPHSFPCTVASVDGAVRFTCAERGDNGEPLRLRLAGLDADGLGEGCAAGQPCATVHAARATAALSDLALGRRLSCEGNGPFTRSASFCTRPDGVDLSCAMLAGNYLARSNRSWEAHECPS
jgi:hypothetical protein